MAKPLVTIPAHFSFLTIRSWCILMDKALDPQSELQGPAADLLPVNRFPRHVSSKTSCLGKFSSDCWLLTTCEMSLHVPE